MPARAVSLVVAIGCVLLGLSGCAGMRNEPAPPPPPEPVSIPPLAPLPAAADGTNLAACTGGSCEVKAPGAVTIPLDARFGLADVRVLSIGPDNVRLSASAPGGGSVRSTRCSVNIQTATAAAPGLVTGDCRTGGRMTFEKVSIGVATIGQDGAILRVVPR